MSKAPLFPEAVNKVDTWLSSPEGVTLVQQSAARRPHYVRAWRLKDESGVLAQALPTLLLPSDFPLSPARIELSPELCLVMPHLESDGNFCHNVLPEPQDLERPVEAVWRVLQVLQEFLDSAQNPRWVEAEFHRERQDYWLRHAAAATAHPDYKTDELLLDLEDDQLAPQAASTITFGSGRRALATTGSGGPEDVVKARGWTLGTIVRGSTLALRLPSDLPWTPKTWPTSFSQLAALAAQIAGKRDILPSWYMPSKWKRKAPVFVAIVQEKAVFGWRLIPRSGNGKGDPILVPVKVRRIDRSWCLSRDHKMDQLALLSGKHIVVFGCGSLGSPVVELLARAGIGQIDVIDPQLMEPENVSRHMLGASSIGYKKCEALCTRVGRAVPGAKLKPFFMKAQQWFAMQDSSSVPDLVLDCSGEYSVRVSTSCLRHDVLRDQRVMMAWMEPFCAAAHVVTVTGDEVWPSSDPADAINTAAWSDEYEVKLPGCGHGFHPYGMADVWRVAGLVAERAIELLLGKNTQSDVISMIRNKGYFDSVAPGLVLNRKVPDGTNVDAITERRSLQDALHAK